jgi:predicted transcriptional regulator
MTHKVKDWMSSPIIIVDPDSSVAYALPLMRRRNIRSRLVAIDHVQKPLWNPDNNRYS